MKHQVRFWWPLGPFLFESWFRRVGAESQMDKTRGKALLFWWPGTKSCHIWSLAPPKPASLKMYQCCTFTTRQLLYPLRCFQLRDSDSDCILGPERDYAEGSCANRSMFCLSCRGLGRSNWLTHQRSPASFPSLCDAGCYKSLAFRLAATPKSWIAARHQGSRSRRAVIWSRLSHHHHITNHLSLINS